MMSVRTYKKMVREMNVGDVFFYNAISGTMAMLDLTKELIKTGKITPVREEIEKAVTPESLELFLSGKCVMPQMFYQVVSK